MILNSLTLYFGIASSSLLILLPLFFPSPYHSSYTFLLSSHPTLPLLSFLLASSSLLLLLFSSLHSLPSPGARSAASIILRGANDFMVDEMERSLHDSLCVVKRVLESNLVVPGGGAVETALSIYLENFATSIVRSYYVHAVQLLEFYAYLCRYWYNI